jgi:hypothetical protein
VSGALPLQNVENRPPLVRLSTKRELSATNVESPKALVRFSTKRGLGAHPRPLFATVWTLG